MFNIDEEIREIDEVICENILFYSEIGRKIFLQNILGQLRNLVEHVALKIFSEKQQIVGGYDDIKLAVNNLKSNGKYKFLADFHNLLQISVSHYTPDKNNSERLMLKYYEYLFKIKNFIMEKYNIELLHNLNEFPINTDPDLIVYYNKIATEIEKINEQSSKHIGGDRYYVQKIKPFFINDKVYYEVTFITVNSNTSKFDNIIAFTDLELAPNYAVNLRLTNKEILVLETKIPITIITDWQTSIRPCEFNNFAKIMDIHIEVQSSHNEYKNLMEFLTKTDFNLLDIIEMKKNQYNIVKQKLTGGSKVTPIFKVLDKSRIYIHNSKPGSNVIRYLLYKFNNSLIKNQFKVYKDKFTGKVQGCHTLSGLYLNYGCTPFDQMPFNSSLMGHNPKLIDLFRCIDLENRKHELLARVVKNNTEINGQLYMKIDEIDFLIEEEIDSLIEIYNQNLYKSHKNRSLVRENKIIYIKEYEENSLTIIKKLQELGKKGVRGYSNSVKTWLADSSYTIDCKDKENILVNLFNSSKVALIYGAAGTGKTTIINHISTFFQEQSKIFLANTNPAVENLKRRVNVSNENFMTISKFISNKSISGKSSILVIDECSTVSNRDMKAILNKAEFKLLVLVGDVYQIESITFGNWFSMAQRYVPSTSVFELETPYRTNDKKLLRLWDRVRAVDNNILETLTKNKNTGNLDKSIFDKSDTDEIILCLNYNGLYGINNINRIIQKNNNQREFYWANKIYKINDPILFNESNRFYPIIYNNLKGIIRNIEIFDRKIKFEIEIDKTINELDAEGYDFILVDNNYNNKSIISFYVNKYETSEVDEDNNMSKSSVVPFQVAYAVSIHKAQGLEYNSVKIVMTNEVEEMITLNIFYTAITRTRNKLKIYWSPETEKYILENLKKRDLGRDIGIFSSKLKL